MAAEKNWGTLEFRKMLIRILIAAGADVNAKISIDQAKFIQMNPEEQSKILIGATPLHFATRSQNAPIVALLIKASADITAEIQNPHCQFNGWTALDFARRMAENQEIIALIEAEYQRRGIAIPEPQANQRSRLVSGAHPEARQLNFND